MKIPRAHWGQNGKGYESFPVYQGIKRQYGNGLGSLFKIAMKAATPVVKQVAKAGLQSATQVAKTQGKAAIKDILAGKQVKDIFKQRGQTALKTLGKSTIARLVDKSIKETRKRKPGHSRPVRRPVKRSSAHKKRPAKKIKFDKDIFN